MSLERIRVRAFADPATAIEQSMEGFALGFSDRSPQERRGLEIVAEHAKAAVIELARQPLEITIAWPAGLPKDARDTLTAQLHHELQALALARLKAEFVAVFGVGPELAKDLSTWLGGIMLASAKAAQQDGV